MGFFDSLWEGVKEGGKFIVDNAGDILNAGKSIARVAGFRMLDEEEVTEVNIIAQSDRVLKVFDDYGKAAKRLEKQARVRRKTMPDLPQMMAMKDPVTNTSSLSGLWINPVAVTGADQGHVKSMDTYQDLSKLLTLLGAPLITVSNNYTVEDTAALLAQSLFANAPVEQSSLETDDALNPVSTTVASITDSATDTHIKAAHSYYEIPMGDTTSKNVWHGALDVSVQRSKASCMREISLRGETTYEAESQPITSGSSWEVALNVDWADRRAADLAMKETKVTIQKLDNSYSIIANSLTGRTQIVRLKTPAGKTPADARVFMVTVVRTIMDGPQAENHQQAAMPQILVTTSLIA
ncbi:unnamed protein product [Aspergillus oryzae]|nr:unnamed protein product [Aspergillus oryzae]GMF91612.1 unnamed protein product [Aspergillus oryzae]